MRLWKHRNQIVHGETGKEQARVLQSSIHSQVTQLYCKFQDNPSFILARHQYLFETKTLAERPCMSYDSLSCWLRSVQKAVKVKDFQDTVERKNAARVFRHRHIHAPFLIILIALQPLALRS
jgi:hypothetical protein